MAAQAAIRCNEKQGGADSRVEDGREKDPFVYILASKRDGVLYVGVTSNLAERIGGFVKNSPVDKERFRD